MIKNKDKMELRYYDIPQSEFLMALYGDSWRRIYGPESTVVEKHIHNLTEIGICLEGTGYMCLDDKKLNYEANVITIIPSNYPHYTKSVPVDSLSHWEYLFIDFERLIQQMYPDDVIFQKSMMDKINHTAYLKKCSEIPEITNIVKQIFVEVKQHRELYLDSVRSLAVILAIWIIRMSDSGSNIADKLDKKSSFEQLRTSLEYIENHYDQNIKIATLAGICHMSESHYRRVFVANMRMSPLDYINRLRIIKACNMIKTNKYLIEDIAVKTGFSTTSTFNRNFKKITGMTPVHWKKEHDNYESQLSDFSITVEKGW